MNRRIWTTLVGIVSIAALIAVPSALAAYTSPKLQVTQAASAVTITASLSPDDDPTAVVRVLAPAGTQLTTTQAPGTVLGPVKALVKALDLGGADLQLTGQLLVAAPGQVPPAAQTACLQATTPLATWVMVLQAAGQTLIVPTYLVATPGAPSPAYYQVCLPPPDVPASFPGRATFGAKLYSAELTIAGVFSSVPVGAWVSTWTPYNPGAGTVNLAGTVAAPAAIAPGAVTLTAKRKGLGAIVAGRGTQLSRLGKAAVKANGTFAFTARRGTFFRATATAAPGSAPPLCAALASQLPQGIPCVNPTVNGFVAQSRVVKKK